MMAAAATSRDLVYFTFGDAVSLMCFILFSGINSRSDERSDNVLSITRENSVLWLLLLFFKVIFISESHGLLKRPTWL